LIIIALQALNDATHLSRRRVGKGWINGDKPWLVPMFRVFCGNSRFVHTEFDTPVIEHTLVLVFYYLALSGKMHLKGWSDLWGPL